MGGSEQHSCKGQAQFQKWLPIKIESRGWRGFNWAAYHASALFCPWASIWDQSPTSQGHMNLSKGRVIMYLSDWVGYGGLGSSPARKADQPEPGRGDSGRISVTCTQHGRECGQGIHWEWCGVTGSGSHRVIRQCTWVPGS